MKTIVKRGGVVPEFTDRRDRIREMKTRRPDIYKALKDPEPLACLAWNLISYRAAKGWTQQGLAKEAGMSKRAVAYIESFNDDYNVSVRVVQRIAKALGVKFTDLFKHVDMTKM